MPVVNLFDDEWTDANQRDGYRSRDRRLGSELGAQKLGGTIYLLEPGSRICPYHWHFAEEEWVVVLDGEATVRTPEGELPLRTGDVCAFPTGPVGAHDVTNRGDRPLRVLMLSTVSDPEICVYPDSGKAGAYAGFARTDGARMRLLNRESANVDYYDGER